MTEVGKRLKEKRLEKNISMEELQSITKIQKRYLEAIEEGKYEVLPGKFYARAFLKQYAEAVGLDSEILFDEFENEIPKSSNEEAPELVPRAERKSTRINSKSTTILDMLPKILLVLLIIGLFVASYFFIVKTNNPKENVEQNNPSNDVDMEVADKEENNIEDENLKVVDETKDNKEKEKEDANAKDNAPDSNGVNEDTQAGVQQLTQVSATNVGTPYTTFNLDANEFLVEITANPNDRSYIGVKNGFKKSFFQQEIANGATQTFDFSTEQEIEINIGNTKGVVVKVNGAEVVLPYEDSHQKMKIVLKKTE